MPGNLKVNVTEQGFNDRLRSMSENQEMKTRTES